MMGCKPALFVWAAGMFGLMAGWLGTWYGAAGPIMRSLLVALGVLFWSDTVLGITCALALRKEKLQSTKLRRVPMKMLQYTGLVVLCYQLDSIYGQVGGSPTHTYLIEIAGVFSVVFHEFTSVLEHLKEMEPLTGFRIPNFVGRKLQALTEMVPGASELTSAAGAGETPPEETK